MTTQLRLVEPPEPVRRAAPRGARPQSRTRKATVTRSPRAGRRAVAWGEWHLDARTRRVGQAGVARARQALEAAAAQELSEAS